MSPAQRVATMFSVDSNTLVKDSLGSDEAQCRQMLASALQISRYAELSGAVATTTVTSFFKAEIRDESDEAAKKIKTAERDAASRAHQSGLSSITEHETAIDDTTKIAEELVHRPKTGSLLLTHNVIHSAFLPVPRTPSRRMRDTPQAFPPILPVLIPTSRRRIKQTPLPQLSRHSNLKPISMILSRQLSGQYTKPKA
jgi:hypothetical protein